MRRISTLTVGAAFAALGAVGLQAPAFAQTPAPAPSEAPRPATPPAITSVNVVDLDELPEATRTQVNQALASRTADDLQKLRNAVEAAPEIRSALEAKGLTSRDVIVAQVSQTGALTLVTKKSG